MGFYLEDDEKIIFQSKCTIGKTKTFSKPVGKSVSEGKITVTNKRIFWHYRKI